MTYNSQKLYKICIVGDGAVGKTTILHRYVDGKFDEDTMMTIGTNFFIKSVILDDFSVNVKFQIWDLGGQPHFAAVRPSFYAGAMGLIFTYDLTRYNTFINLRNWKREIDSSINMQLPGVLIGNKLDLVKPKTKSVRPKELNEMLIDLDADDYFKTSAKTGDGIEEAFKCLALKIFSSKIKPFSK